jgi:hypothetical protein
MKDDRNRNGISWKQLWPNETVSKHLCGRTEENIEKPQAG